MFSTWFDKQVEDNRVLDENELYINLSINENRTESDIDKIVVWSQLEQQIQNQGSEGSDWRFDKLKSLTMNFY